jgi:hypothetical protein
MVLKLVLRGLQASEVLEKYRFDLGSRLKFSAYPNLISIDLKLHFQMVFDF